ncbi:hypothetical protein AB0A63_09535 [Lentzea sp. NPDC042327]|uniref:hypothetical protein n=1 Tax=Lentzea sp. NPDC042327 TaxID=3154801 RepID=UPI0033EC8522
MTVLRPGRAPAVPAAGGRGADPTKLPVHAPENPDEPPGPGARAGRFDTPSTTAVPQ